MDSVTFVKLGGSLLTDKTRPYTPRPAVIERLAEEMAQAWPALEGALVVGHGSGSFGHAAAQDTGLADPNAEASAEGLSCIQHAAHRLHRHVMDAFRNAQLPAVSFAPSSLLVTDEGQPVSLHDEPVRRALLQGALPITFGDVTLDRTRGGAICSTETVLRALCGSLQRAGVGVGPALWFGNTEGVYDASGDVVDSVSPSDAEEVLSDTAGSGAPDVTGGMRHRVETALHLAHDGVASLIAGGSVTGRLQRALRGRAVPGTWVLPPTADRPPVEEQGPE
jgi:isopentenyl phosphate kinase